MQPKMTAPLTMKDNNKCLSVRVGSTLEIHLEGNPTTGYTWTRVGFVGKEMLSDEHLEVTSKYTPKPVSGSMVGAGGSYTVFVKPLRKGQHAVQLVYARPFEGPKPDNERYTLHLNVE
ncbi:inhibitor of cysteine peptidase [Leishmania major strain Friedlin]|uniref:Inhibitor of cysteine peptidase n=1 Tax=Leishmania major TaxID=5664 RepID=Q868G9_LEIMA|nr:inhibitor of cysteine peptidase [Leishmania major strain Friedlin]CAD69563.1 inhibitor of cysteine peptidase [Leishmania major]CAG9574650.1 inhibitor_of_cysteine_peptidase [Leishmania major strain Friedlin]CAJ05225.1 inhibitor of cysteine peptidase [Leishmania major strain Friedlin]|eukprot:XP_001683694.1 inhibitor of cysteine peptidase [Leishmania major strain Friedlin]